MAKKSRILVDTDIFIKIYRGDKEKHKAIAPIQDNLAISAITAIELMMGAKNKKKQIEVSKTIKAYFFCDITSAIGARAFTLVKKYGLSHFIGVADALIAATAIENKISLYTDNISDYEFIKELKLYKP
jgi:predicted nucleic acid-binding protein